MKRESFIEMLDYININLGQLKDIEAKRELTEIEKASYKCNLLLLDQLEQVEVTE